MSKSIKPVIFGIACTELTEEEKHFLATVNPLGFILFARNCQTPEQVKALTRSLFEILQRDDVLIFIDQEGGRVSRLRSPYWRNSPAASKFAAIAGHSIALAKQAVYANARLIGRELYEIGINANCAPLADVPVAGAHEIIGDRAYGNDAHQISILAAEMAKGMQDGGILPVLKHIPGHGRATSDSHEELPVVNESLDILQRSDFIPFKSLHFLPVGMTAHIIYTALDIEYPATISGKVINFIRQEIKFDGLLLSDDISMKALKGDIAELSQMILAAGCDIVLHCNGNMKEMRQIAAAVNELNADSARRFANAISHLHPPFAFNYKEAEAMIDEL